MFAAMKEAGDVMGVFVGHDHDNDYAVMWKNILLAYGRYTGGNTVYNHCDAPVSSYWMKAPVHLLPGSVRKTTSWIKSLIRQALSRTIGLNVEVGKLHMTKACIFRTIAFVSA